MAQQPSSCDSSDVQSAETTLNDQSGKVSTSSMNSEPSRSKYNSKQTPKQSTTMSHTHSFLSSKANKQKVHSMNIHETMSESKTESKNEEFGDFIHLMIDGRIPKKKKTSEAIARLEKLRKQGKDNVEFLTAVDKRKDAKVHTVIKDFAFESKDKKKRITCNDICKSISSARNISNTLSKLMDKGKKIAYNKSRNRVLEFVFDEKYHIFLYVYTQEEIKKMPDWCISKNTQCGMSQYFII